MIIKRTIKAVVLLGVALVMYGAMNKTLPSKDQHVIATSQMVKRVMDKVFMDKIHFPEESREIADYISNTLIPQATQKAMSENLDIKDFGIANIGTIETVDGDDEILSLGILGKVFTFGEEETYERLEKYMNMSNVDEAIDIINKKKY